MERTLEIVIKTNGEEFFSVDVREPESGCNKQFQFAFSPSEHPEFNEVIGEEIYSWISLWAESEAEEA